MRSGAFHFPAHELSLNYEVDDVNPVTTEGWRWVACELMADRLDDGECISRGSKATDVWSFAMTVVEVYTSLLCIPLTLNTDGLQILTGAIPMGNIRSDARVVLYVSSGGRPKRELYPQINDAIWAMLERCWDVTPNRRPSMAALSQFFAAQVGLILGERSRL